MTTSLVRVPVTALADVAVGAAVYVRGSTSGRWLVHQVSAAYVHLVKPGHPGIIWLIPVDQVTDLEQIL